MENRSGFKQLCAKGKNKPEKLEKYGLYLANWAKKYLEQTGAFGYVVGISGGIDSALALAILSQNKDLKLIGAFVDIESSKQDLADAKLLVGLYNFDFVYIDLNDEYHALVKKLGLEKHSVACQNLKSRLRANALYALAAKNSLLTCGTTNAAERVVGYYTKFGDSACDIALLSYLNKAQVRYLAQLYKVPLTILSKAPSAGLTSSQTDEKDLGLTYEEIDHYLCYANINPDAENKINAKYLSNKHKLNAPARPKPFMKFRNTK